MAIARIRAISRDNGAGLSRDLKLIAAALASEQADVEVVGFGATKAFNWWREAGLWARRCVGGRMDTQIFAERIYPRCLPLGRRNLLVPNPEWFLAKWLPHLRDFDLVLCKTRHAERIFRELGCRTQYIGFTCEDRYDPTVARQEAFFHLAGRSTAKGTKVLMETWRQHPQWPLLTVVQSRRDLQPGPAAANIDHRIGYMDDRDLRQLQNAHRFHICPSEAEGFGHYLAEAMSVGAVVITTDGEPMNELVTAERGILIRPVHVGRKELSKRYVVDSRGIEAAVQRTLELSADDCERIGLAARKFHRHNEHAFYMRLAAVVLADDPYWAGALQAK